jgi:hypothetical protein
VWVSDFTYQAFVERVAELNGNLRIIKPPAASYRTLLVDASAKTQWAFKPNGPRVPTGKPETARVLGADGKLFTEVTVYRLADSEHGYSVMIPEPKPGWHSIEVKGSKPYAFSAASSVLPLLPRP